MNAPPAFLAAGLVAPHHLNWLDWLVIAAYGLAMLGIGWFYSRRNQTREDYFLGGREMKPGAIGLSLFATLLSSISYLSWPGEMIKHGPVLFFTFLAYPFIILIVGWFMIPFFMRLPVTSAYEILELRLGVKVRLLGAVLFLSLRLLWMAMIIYTTTDKGPDPADRPPSVPRSLDLCVDWSRDHHLYLRGRAARRSLHGRGHRTLILFAGAILTLAVITDEPGRPGRMVARPLV